MKRRKWSSEQKLKSLIRVHLKINFKYKYYLLIYLGSKENNQLFGNQDERLLNFNYFHKKKKDF